MSNDNMGAVPRLDEEFSTPGGEQKSKTNVNKFAILGVGIIAFLFLIVSIMIFQKTRGPAATQQSSSELARKPGYEEKNTEVESSRIDSEKARIREEENKRAAEAARVQAEIDAAERKAREAAQGTPEQQKAVMEDDPDARAMRSGVLLPLTGTGGGDADAEEEKGAGGKDARRPRTNRTNLSESEQRQREYEARLRAAGIGSDSEEASSDGESLGDRLKPTQLPAVTAGRLKNLTYLLKKGTTIPCALKNGIDTQLPGFVLCNVINDVYSANGKTLLIERGATLFGEQQSSLRQGQERTFVIWSRIDNPSGVSVNIDSPAVDSMGYSGIPGIVNHRFFQRFGAAILLSIVKDFSRAAADRYSRRNGGFYSGDSSDDASAMAAEALKNDIDIPPTLIVKPATVVHVMVARDVSFENVYTLISKSR